MYVSEVDNLLEETIDKIMVNWIYENKLKNLMSFKSIVSEINIVKNQKKINETLSEIIYSIDEEKFKSFVSKEDNLYFIKNTLIKYLLYYIFIMIGLNYVGSEKDFITNLIDFTREQINYPIKVEGFFLPESNNNIIKYTKLIKEFTEYLQISEQKKSKEEDKFSKNLKEFINEIGEDKIKSFKEIIQDKNNKIIYQHNMVKLMIFMYIYTNEEKKELFNVIEENELPTGEYMFIDIVVPKDSFTDISVVESILSPKEIKTSLLEIIYNLINTNYDEEIIKKRDYFLNFDAKIQELFNTEYIIPIVDDFLLYHKNNEKYDDIEKVNKKKEDTKIKFIVNKINLVREYYKNKKDIEKKFYQPMKSKNIVLVNELENIKILQKLKKIINVNDENLVLTNDLNKFRKYPYISFIDIEKNGFCFKSDKTLECIRLSSFTQKNKNIPLQTRIMSEDSFVNIVGFAMLNKKDYLNCTKTCYFKDIYSVTNNPIEYINKTLLNKINNNFLNQKDESKGVYWIFDSEKDNYSVPQYDMTSSTSQNENIKMMTTYFYDKMLIDLLEKFGSVVEKNKDINYYFDLLGNIINKNPNIKNDQYMNSYDQLLYEIYFKLSNTPLDTYDKNEDIFFGMFGDVIKLPKRERKKIHGSKIINIKTDYPYSKSIEETYKNEYRDLVNIEFEEEDNKNNKSILSSTTICQHFIHWNNLLKLEKENKTDYTNLVYEFGQQYVKVNANMEYLCKSCNAPLDIKKFIIDGSFDSQTQFFVTNSLEVNVNIEELQEYEKYKTAIRSIDKIIERFANIFNIANIMGITYSARKTRRTVVKDVVDLVINNNSYLEKIKYLGKRDTITSKLNIDKPTNFFIFSLDNNIFIYSSKDKDYMKILKYNNVICYILIVMMLEMNDSQILNLNYDQICNYSIYKKVQNILFGDSQIIVDKEGNLEPIKNYPNLCYIIFMFSCLITKYNLWGDPHETDTNVKKFNPTKQKTIINTLIEILYTINTADVEEMKKNRIYLYEILQNKYYLRMEMFKSTKLTSILDKMFLQDFNSKKDKNISDESNKFDISPSLKTEFVFDNLYKEKIKYPDKRDKYPKFINNLDFLRNLSNLTNCYDGRFHDYIWDKEKVQYICKLCGKVGNIKNYEEKSLKQINRKVVIRYLNELLEKYCKSGELHQFIYNFKTDKSVCKKCNFVFGDKVSMSEEDLFKTFNKINNKLIEAGLKINKEIEKSKQEFKKFTGEIRDVLGKVVGKFDKNSNDITITIDKFLDSIQKLLGTNIRYNNEMYNLKYNTYIVDHDNTGQKLENLEIIYENEDKFREVDEHPYFKRNVIIYSTKKAHKYEIFYDAQDKFLLGYRETNKDYIKINTKKNKLKINYSLKNILNLFGFTRKVIDIKDFYPEIYGMSIELFREKFKNFDITKLLNKISNRRLEVIKNLGNELNKYIYRFKNNYDIEKDLQEDNKYSDNTISSLDLIYINYKRKIGNNLSISSKDKKHRFLKYNNTLYKYLPYQNIVLTNKNLQFEELVAAEFVSRHDYNSNLDLSYILMECIRLLDYNTNKHIRTNIAHFIVDIIIDIFNKTNYDVSKFNSDVNYFYQILYTSEFYLETQATDVFIDTLDYYNEQDEVEIDNFKTINVKNEENEKEDDDYFKDNEDTGEGNDVINTDDMDDDEIENEEFEIDNQEDYEGVYRNSIVDALGE